MCFILPGNEILGIYLQEWGRGGGGGLKSRFSLFVFVIFMEDEKQDKKSSPSAFPACLAGKASAGQSS